MNLLLERGLDQGFFPDSSKYPFIADSPDQEEAMKRCFEAEGIHLKVVGGSWYMGAYLSPR